MSFSVNPATLSMSEGNGGTQVFQFVVTESGYADSPVYFSTRDGTAKSSQKDYQSTSGAL